MKWSMMDKFHTTEFVGPLGSISKKLNNGLVAGATLIMKMLIYQEYNGNL